MSRGRDVLNLAIVVLWFLAVGLLAIALLTSSWEGS